MNIAKTYGNIVRKYIDRDPEKAKKLIIRGLYLESFRIRHFYDKRIPKAYQHLNYNGIRLVADALKNPETLAWTNIFAPVEILQNFGLTSVSMECLSSYLSGFWLEDTLIDRAESAAIAQTLCSYHKNFIGAADAGIIPKPVIGVTTTMVCDGNVQSFRYFHERMGIPVYIIDVPYEDTPEAVQYVKEQLQELIAMLEDITGRRFDEAELRRALDRENRTKQYYLEYMEKRKTHAYPNTLTLILFQLFATHLDIGMQWPLDVFREMSEEIEHYPLSHDKRLFWIHLEPYAQPSLREYLNLGDQVSICAGDFDLDYIKPLDTEHPLDALAAKMTGNIYNGDFSRKVDAIREMIKKYEPDGVVEFCHWGCSQSSGGVMLMKQMVSDLGLPMLILDGDAVDRRNSPDGQIRTRFEAFLEVLQQEDVKGGA